MQKLTFICALVICFTGLSSCIKTVEKAPKNIDKEMLLTLVNNYRQSGCNCGSEYFPPVDKITWNDTLEKAAKDHSDDMNKKDFFEHAGSDGSSPGDRISKNGYQWSTIGENIAEGYSSEKDVINGWIKSPGHCANIMDKNYKEMGIASAGIYWTQDFASH